MSSDGESMQYIANEIGNFKGKTAFYISKPGQYIISVEAKGSWNLTFGQPTDFSGAKKITKFSGNGNSISDFFIASAGLATFTFKHDGDSNFIVRLLNVSKGTEYYLTNEIGHYDGQTAEKMAGIGNVYLFSVDADGNWSIQIEQ